MGLTGQSQKNKMEKDQGSHTMSTSPHTHTCTHIPQTQSEFLNIVLHFLSYDQLTGRRGLVGHAVYNSIAFGVEQSPSSQRKHRLEESYSLSLSRGLEVQRDGEEPEHRLYFKATPSMT